VAGMIVGEGADDILKNMQPYYQQ